MKWYNFKNGGRVPPADRDTIVNGRWFSKHVPHIRRAAGGVAYTPTATAAPIVAAPEATAAHVSSYTPYEIPANAVAAYDPVANAEYYDPNSARNTYTPEAAPHTLVENLGSAGLADVTGAASSGDQYLWNEANNANLAEAAAVTPGLEYTDFGAPPPTVEEYIAAGTPLPDPEVVDHAGIAPVVDIDLGEEAFIQLDNTVPTAPVENPRADNPFLDLEVPADPVPQPVVVNTPQGPVTTYMSGPGVNTGIPQGGFARNAINQYLTGTGNTPTLSYGAASEAIANQRDINRANRDLIQQDFDERVAIIDEATAAGDDSGIPVDEAAELARETGWDNDTSNLSAEEWNEQVDIIRDETGLANYDPSTDVLWDELNPEGDPDFRLSDEVDDAAETIYENTIADVGASGPGWFGEPTSFDNPSETGSYGGSLTTGEYSGNPTGADAVTADLYNFGANTLIGSALGFEPVTTADRVGWEAEAYEAAVNSGEVAAFDPNDPSTWVTPGTDFETDVTNEEEGFRDDLARSLSDPNYNPDGTVLSRALGLTEGQEEANFNAVDAELEAATAISRNNNDDDGPSHAEIIASHNAIREAAAAATTAESNLINSDVSDDDFWDTWEDSSISTGGNDDGGSDSGGGGGGFFGGYSCYVGTALEEKGLWSSMKKTKLLVWCMRTMPEGKFRTKLWRNGYTEFGQKVIAPRAEKFQWVSDGFYDGTVKGKRNLKSLIGMGFYFIPSFAIGLYKWATGKLVEIDRT